MADAPTPLDLDAIAAECDLADRDMRKWVRYPVKRLRSLLAEVKRLRTELEAALAVVARIREVRPTYAEWEHRAIVAERTVDELLATSPARETYDLTDPRNPRREGQACDRLYVWRASPGYWVVSTAPKARHATGSGRSYHRSQPEAFADAWARTHPRGEA